MEALQKARLAARILDAKKAKDITVLGVAEITYISDYFVICTASNSRMLEALSRELCDKMTQAGVSECRVEGKSASGWILIDFSDVVVHLFKGDTREFYGLESLWGDSVNIDPLLESEN